MPRQPSRSAPVTQPLSGRDPRARRAQILQGALACFTERGIVATTMAEIRARSGASTGSIYHQFESKDAIAAELYVEALGGYQAELLEVLGRHRTAAAGVAGIVTHYLDWTFAHPALARFLFEARRDPAVAPADARIGELNATLFRAVRGWLRPFVEAGEVVTMPMELWVAVVIGPSADYARAWLAGRAHTEFKTAKKLLAAAACGAVMGTRSP